MKAWITQHKLDLAWTLEEATANAEEALGLYVEGLREDGRSFDTGVIRRRFPVPA